MLGPEGGRGGGAVPGNAACVLPLLEQCVCVFVCRGGGARVCVWGGVHPAAGGGRWKGGLGVNAWVGGGGGVGCMGAWGGKWVSGAPRRQLVLQAAR